jgi:hypothetical protein
MTPLCSLTNPLSTPKFSLRINDLQGRAPPLQCACQPPGATPAGGPILGIHTGIVTEGFILTPFVTEGFEKMPEIFLKYPHHLFPLTYAQQGRIKALARPRPASVRRRNPPKKFDT